MQARVSELALAARADAVGNLASLDAWSIRYFPSYFPLGLSVFHHWLAAELTGLHARRGTRLNVIAPRGSAKSTWSTFAYPLYCAVHGLEPYVILTSDTGNQAEKYLDAIRAELEANDDLRADYPQACGQGETWRYDRIRLRNGVMIEAVGTGTKLRGRRNRQHRPSLIVSDDPQNTGHIISQLQRERSWEWLTKDVCNAGSSETNIISLGTALHRDCIVCRLQRTAGWQSHLFRAVVEWPKRMDRWAEWESIYCDWDNADRELDAKAFYEQNRDAMNDGAVILWPDRESLYDLMSLRVTIGAGAFGSEKQGSPINPAACEWPEAYFDAAGFWFETWPVGLECRVIALDPSKGRDARRGDYSAYVRLGMDRSGVLYCEADLDRRDTAVMVDAGIEHVRRFCPDGVAVETNQYQELLAPLFIGAATAAKAGMPLYQIDNRVSKEVRIRRIGPLLSQRRIRFKARSPGTALLVQQLRDFPAGDHDDGPDALEMAYRLLCELTHRPADDGELEVTVLRW